MENIENVILSFKSSYPWEFYKYVMTSELNQEEKNLFNEIWTKAGDFELWNFSDLILACKSSQSFIRENYKLSEEAIAKVVNAISYSWK